MGWYLLGYAKKKKKGGNQIFLELLGLLIAVHSSKKEKIGTLNFGEHFLTLFFIYN